MDVWPLPHALPHPSHTHFGSGADATEGPIEPIINPETAKTVITAVYNHFFADIIEPPDEAVCWLSAQGALCLFPCSIPRYCPY